MGNVAPFKEDNGAMVQWGTWHPSEQVKEDNGAMGNVAPFWHPSFLRDRPRRRLRQRARPALRVRFAGGT